jgi:hypothetical protein
LLAGYQIVHWLSGANLLVAEQRPDAVAGNVSPIAAAGADLSAGHRRER